MSKCITCTLHKINVKVLRSSGICVVYATTQCSSAIVATAALHYFFEQYLRALEPNASMLYSARYHTRYVSNILSELIK